jgi:hypothetical protein
MMDRLSPGPWLRWERRRQVPPCSRGADAIRRLGLPALLCRSNACEPINFALIRHETGMKLADCIRPTH